MSTPTILSQITGDSARTRETDPATSHEAADSISREALEDSEREVLTILAECPLPQTDEALTEHHEARAFLGLAARTYTPARLRTARAQLVELGRVVEGAERGRTKTGRSARTWTLPERTAA